MTSPFSINLKRAHRAVVLVYALLVLSVLLVVTTVLSLYVVRQIRNAALASQTVAAHYIAEAGVEEGLYLFRHEQENLPELDTPVTVDNLADPFGTAHQLARIASTTDQDISDQPFFSSQAWAELFATNTISEIIMDVRKDEVAYADVYDASKANDLVGSGVGSIKLAWDANNTTSWLEVSKVNIILPATGGGQLGASDTILLGPSAATGLCAFTDLQSPDQSFHRFRFRALEANVRNLKITGYSGNLCDGNSVSLPGRLTINSTGRYQAAKQTVQISMPQQRAPSGLFGFVMFSDQPLVKLNIGQGNLRWWPRPLPGSSGDTFTFKNLGNPNPSASTTAAQLYTFANDTSLFYSGANRYPGGIASENGTAIFTLVNTALNGAIPSGEISLAINSSYGEAFAMEQDFSQEHIGDAIDGKDFIAFPPDSSNDPNRTRLMTCEKLRATMGGSLRLGSYGSTGVVLGPPDAEGNRTAIAYYYTDRCALGVKLNPVGITTGVTGRLLAYGDPGGTASMDLTWTMPGPNIILPSNINFGTVYVGIATDRQISVGNNGEANLNVTNINTGSPLVTVTSGNAPFSVPVGGQQNVNFRFTPTQAGSFSGNITVTSNDRGSPHTIAWSGTAATEPDIVVNPNPYNFGQVTINTEATGQLTVTNNGGSDLIISNLTSDNQAIFWFDVSSPFPISLNPGGNTSLNIKFKPTQVTSYNSNLHIINNDPDQGDYVVAVTGQGLTSMIGVPSNLQVTWANVWRYDATWTDGVTNELRYRFGSTVPSTSDASLAANLTSYTDTIGVNECTKAITTSTWNFYVDASDDVSWTARATKSVARPGLEAATGLYVERLTDTSIVLHWTDNSTVNDGYVVYQNGTAYATTTANSQAFSGLTVGTLYTFTVRPYLSSNQGGVVRCNPLWYVYGAQSSAVGYKPGTRRILVTPGLHDGVYEDDDGDPGNNNWYVSADAFCQAQLSSRGSTWKALMRDTLGWPPQTIVHIGVAYTNYLGQSLFTATGDNVPSLILANPVHSGLVATDNVYTGYNGTSCLNWSVGGLGAAKMGRSDFTDNRWLDGGDPWGYYCYTPKRIYCVEQ